jgi:U3 small nucleolar RNA-associated protein 20
MKELNTKGGSNRFKYSSFNDIISTISIDVSHVIRKSKLEEDFYFKQGLIKWKDLNASNDFKSFLKDINNYVSLVQLVHHQKEIVDILLKHLRKSGSLAIEPLLWLSVDLAKDLLEDFFPFYLDFLKSFTDLLESVQDPHLIQSIFTSIAWLFKINAKSLVKDIIPTFDILLHLLNSKDYIQGFTAESFGFLVRKLNTDQLSKLLLKMRQHLEDQQENIAHGFGLVIIESIKHVQGNLHSKGLEILKEVYLVFSNNRLIMEHIAGLAPKALANEALSEVFGSLVNEIRLHSMDDYYSLCSMFSSANILLLHRNGSYLKGID